jgi:small subunit ribosomal protein S2e
MGEGGFGKGGFGKGKKGKGKKGGKKGKGKGDGDDKWVPCTKLGRLVQAGKIDTIEDIYLHSLPIREYQIIDHFFPPSATGNGVLKDEIVKIHPVQKMTSAGQRNRFVAYALVGDSNGHVGLGNKVGKEVANAIRGAIISAKLALIPVRRGYWGTKIGQPHTVPMKVTGKCGSVSVRLIPAPRGTAVVGSLALKKVMAFAGVMDVFSSSCGHTRTKGNFVKATFEALRNTYSFMTPELWPAFQTKPNPYQAFSDDLVAMNK